MLVQMDFDSLIIRIIIRWSFDLHADGSQQIVHKGAG